MVRRRWLIAMAVVGIAAIALVWVLFSTNDIG